MSNSGHRGYGGVERHRRLDIAQRQASDPFCFAPLFGPWTAYIMTSSSFFLSFYLFHPISFAGHRRDQPSNLVENTRERELTAALEHTRIIRTDNAHKRGFCAYVASDEVRYCFRSNGVYL